MSQSAERKRRRAEYMRKYRENMSEERRAQIREYDARRRRSNYMRRAVEVIIHHLPLKFINE